VAPAPLSYAVEQFFDNGGRQAIIVRVANGARPASLRLPAGPGALLLRALAPGTREYLRASVDYDGIPVGAEDQFNLVLQRLRVPDSEWIEEQEILRRLSVLPGSERAVDRVLSASRLMRVAAHCRRSGRTPPGLCERVASSAMWRLAATVATAWNPATTI